MAVDTSVSPLAGVPAAGNKLKVYQRYIDFTTDGDGNLADGAWFTIFDTDPGDVVVGGAVDVQTLDGGGATIDIGIGGADTVLDAGVIASAAVVPVGTGTNALSSAVVGTGPVTLTAKGAAITLAKLTVTLLVLKAGDTSG